MALWNVHRISIKIEHRNLEIRKTSNDFFVQVRNFLLSLSLKVFRHKERHNLSILAFSSAPISCSTRHKATGLASASERKPTVFPEAGLISTNFHQNSPNPRRASGAWRHLHPLAPVSHLGLLWHLWVTRPLWARDWIPVLMLHLTNPCSEPKGSQPN